MGVCMSCLGRARNEPSTSDTSQLLGDGYQQAYGAIGAGNPLPQTDPEEIRRQRDALERLCAQTSDKLIDVAQALPLEDASRLPADLARLFADRPVTPLSPPDSGLGGEFDYHQRPGEDELTWLMRVAPPPLPDGRGDWDVCHPVEGEICLSVEEFLAERERLEGVAKTNQTNQE